MADRLSKGDRVRFTGNSSFAFGTVVSRKKKVVEVELDEPAGATITTAESNLVALEPEQ